MSGQERWELTSFDSEGALPLFIDLHLNGFNGIDLLSASSVDEIQEMNRALYEAGTGGYFASLITAPIDQTLTAISMIESARREAREGSAEILGIHLEGPFLSPEMAGVHPKESLQSIDLEILSKYLAAGTISMVTLAPELPGAISAIKFLSQMGVIVSLGHSAANRDVAKQAFAAGAKSVTHIFNRCSPDLAQVAIEESSAFLQIILDGNHVSDEKALDLFSRAPERIVAVTDALSIAGLAQGRHNLGGTEIEIRDGAAFAKSGERAGTKAGSIATMRQCFEKIIDLGLGHEAAVAACIERPAEIAGRNDLGELAFHRPAHRRKR
jgi:N-acetylglucosamine-6-phosphate deacetylase